MNAVLMLCRNGKELTRNAIESVLAQDLPVQLLCLDQDSQDGTEEMLRNYPVITHRFSPQVGFSAGVNMGLEYFWKRGHNHVLVVNNDVILRSDTYYELMADGGEFATCVGVGSIQQIQGEFTKAVRPHPDFSCFMIRRSVWDKIGMFDETMFNYASDLDYHVRMHQARIKAYTIGLAFYHVASGTIKNSNPEEAQKMHTGADKDRERFQEKWGCRVGSEQYYELFR